MRKAVDLPTFAHYGGDGRGEMALKNTMNCLDRDAQKSDNGKCSLTT